VGHSQVKCPEVKAERRRDREPRDEKRHGKGKVSLKMAQLQWSVEGSLRD
jgi:hypothetical protein